MDWNEVTHAQPATASHTERSETHPYLALIATPWPKQSLSPSSLTELAQMWHTFANAPLVTLNLNDSLEMLRLFWCNSTWCLCPWVTSLNTGNRYTRICVYTQIHIYSTHTRTHLYTQLCLSWCIQMRNLNVRLVRYLCPSVNKL